MYCTHCGKELFENARFCQACGAPVVGAQAVSAVPPAPVVSPPSPVVSEEELFAEECLFLAHCHASLVRERRAWLIMAIVFAVSAFILFATALGMSFAYGIEYTADTWWCGGIAAVLAIIDGCMARKVNGLCATVHTDIRPLADRCSGSGAMVFAAIVNWIALFFLAETVGKMTSKTAVVARIVQRQQTPQEIPQ